MLLTVAAFIFYSCEKTDDSVIDPSFASPLLSDPVKSMDTVYTTSATPVISLATSVTVNLNGGAPINSVTCNVTDPAGNILGRINLSDNGASPDTSAGDGKYSGLINITNINCLIVGAYQLDYVAENSSGLFSNLIISDFNVVNTAAQAPVIASTNLPDSVVRPMPGDSTLLTISVNVTDADGLCDIRDVAFVAVRPNGVVLPAIPMFNNGNGQFIFSNYVAYSTDPTSYGYFKYTFTARDNSNLSSTPVTDSIKFVQPF